MLYLPHPTAKNLESYYDSIKDSVIKRIENANVGNATSQYVISKLRDIIIDLPSDLLKHHEAIMSLHIDNYSESDYFYYLKIKNKNRKNAQEESLCSSYEIVKEIANVFNYDAIISESKKKSYELAQMLNRNTCTYCNRLYTFTVIRKDKKTGRINDSTRITRPQFDHWYAKSIYPCLALSFFNLIPSCSICNSSIKGDERLSLNDHCHPYAQDGSEGFRFSYMHKSLTENNIVIKDSTIKTKQTLDILKIEEVYNAHSAFELKDLLDLRYKYPENYLETLLNNTFESLNISKGEAYRLIFGVEKEEDDFHKRPLSKFKRDIISELLGDKF